MLLESWLQEHNDERLHSSLYYPAPVEFKELWHKEHQQRLLVALDR